eukprot:101406-Amphidinium_carterae.4
MDCPKAKDTGRMRSLIRGEINKIGGRAGKAKEYWHKVHEQSMNYQVLNHTTLLMYMRKMSQNGYMFELARCQSMVKACEGQSEEMINWIFAFQGQEDMESPQVDYTARTVYAPTRGLRRRIECWNKCRFSCRYCNARFVKGIPIERKCPEGQHAEGSGGDETRNDSARGIHGKSLAKRCCFGLCKEMDFQRDGSDLREELQSEQP